MDGILTKKSSTYLWVISPKIKVQEDTKFIIVVTWRPIKIMKISSNPSSIQTIPLKATMPSIFQKSRRATLENQIKCTKKAILKNTSYRFQNQNLDKNRKNKYNSIHTFL